MYQAIVFLPLLGAILAALISLFTARARHPGGTPGTGAHGGIAHGGIHGGGHQDAHAHASPAAHGGADTHDGAHAPPPAGLGTQFAELITTGLLFFAMILSW